MSHFKNFKLISVSVIIFILFSCINTKGKAQQEEEDEIQINYKDHFSFFNDDPYLFILVDKEHQLSADYAPLDLVRLENGLFLRSVAAESFKEMSEAAAAEGLKLTASSTYRSYIYQEEVYARHVRSMGQAAADRVSARPGYSQHQLGLVIDFGSISNEFAQTREGIWLYNNASRFGWSLSYPQGYEEVTGYSWESWHYRYVGKELAEFIDTYFGGIQQYALEFINEIEHNSRIVTLDDFLEALPKQ